MSVITLQLGQCGNQVGGQFFSTLTEDLSARSTGVNPKENKEYINTSTETFFVQSESHGRNGSLSLPKARAVLVDMETKAISQTMQQAKKSGKWAYSENQRFSQKKGSGNNWANGFCIHGPKSQDDVMNLICREAEKCDRLGGFISLLSLAGGTGSGVGAFITQSLRDEYPHSFILNQVVWPYNTGEVIVQNYNAMLTLSHLHDTADALIVMENDSLHKICTQLLNIKNVSFVDINRVIAHKLASVLQPSEAKEHSWTTACDLGFLLERLVSHPQYKLLTVKNIPQMSDVAKEFSVYQWPGLMRNLRQMLISDAPMEEGINWNIRPVQHRTETGHNCFNRSLATVLVLRGRDISNVDTSMFNDPAIYAPWVSPDLMSCVIRQPRLFCEYDQAAALVSNSQASVRPLDRILGKAWTMFSSRAYVHQYLKHGLTEEDFLDSFISLEKVVASYKGL
ncbi:tubulin delta chain [Plakobranchus ocellatus]|uniref:Tubulin delta chain n=1 Tax=Plakobranchus ocellatus TaxID=259542 RepID=A0AAV3ZX39_9GAST|nr:tubulin delta chain [Plakobranchus ocellatus]